MKKVLLILAIAFLSNNCISQNIADLFIKVPDTSLLNLTTEERRLIAKYSMGNKTVNDAQRVMKKNKINYSFETVDLKNGYLKLIGALEGHIQLCYWKLLNGNKLIAVYQEGCGPICSVEQFDFYEYNGSDFVPMELHTIIPDVYNDFIKENKAANLEKMEKQDISSTLLFELPKTGKNIIAKLGNGASVETYKKYAFGNRMILSWNNGKFKKGTIFWK
ncbi:MAG: hypothetical protein WBC06_16825 [Chitinophagaceae bacterium]